MQQMRLISSIALKQTLHLNLVFFHKVCPMNEAVDKDALFFNF
jgi:hypothetical protein